MLRGPSFEYRYVHAKTKVIKYDVYLTLTSVKLRNCLAAHFFEILSFDIILKHNDSKSILFYLCEI